MNYLRYTKTALPLIAAIMICGCNSSKDAPVAPSGAPQEKAATTMTSQDKGAAPTLPPKDMVDAEAAAVLFLAQLEAGDFPGIYKAASAGFKKIGSESQFVSKFQQTRQRVGVLKNPQKISADVRPDKSIVLVYRVENELYNTDLRLTFSRAENGTMELAGLNQHDELKK